MLSLSLKELFRQGRQVVWDSQNTGWGDLDSLMADAVCSLFENMAISEVEHRVGAKLYERGSLRQNYRNGTRERTVQTSFATIRIKIPRLREGGFIPMFLEPRRRAVDVTERFVGQAFMCGVSRAEIIRLMQSTTGCRPSDGLLRNVQSELDKLAGDFRTRQLLGRYEYLFLDAAYAKDLVGGKSRSICIMTAVGVTENGCKEVLGFERVVKESEAGWSRFLKGLVARGLDISAIHLVISDEHRGILRAVEEVLGDVPHQLCWAHRIRNISDALKKSDRPEVMKYLRPIYTAKHRKEAMEAFRNFKHIQASTYPNVVANMEEDLRYLFAFYDAPELHREYVRTSNPVERVFVELRRARFACGAFANRQSCDRVVAGVYQRLNDIWQDKDLWANRERRNYSRALKAKLTSQERFSLSKDEQQSEPPYGLKEIAIQQELAQTG